MKLIVQITQKEYDSLKAKSQLTEVEINKKAEELYRKYGTHKICLTVEAKEYTESIDIQANAYISDWDSKFPLKEEDKKKIVYFVQDKAEEMFRRRFGSVIHNLEAIKKKETKLDNVIRKVTIFTITGWLLAVILIGLFANFA